MIINERDYISGLLDKVERNLRYYADAVARTKTSFEEKGRADELHYLLNELLWSLPNLGIQTVISAAMREMESQSFRGENNEK